MTTSVTSFESIKLLIKMEYSDDEILSILKNHINNQLMGEEILKACKEEVFQEKVLTKELGKLIYG